MVQEVNRIIESSFLTFWEWFRMRIQWEQGSLSPYAHVNGAKYNYGRGGVCYEPNEWSSIFDAPMGLATAKVNSKEK